MRVLHLIAAGNNGGIQTLLKDYAKYSGENNVFSFMWYSGITEEQMRQQGAETICFEAKKSGTFKAAIKLLNYVNEKKPDAVIVHSSPMLRFLGTIIKVFHKEMQLYLYCHAAIKDQLEQYGIIKRTVYDFINRACIEKCEKVIAISNYVKGTVQSAYNTPNEKIAVIYNSVDTEKFDKPIHPAEEKVKIVFIGRVVKVKGIQFAIEALSKIPDNLQWEFNVVGDGAYRDVLEKLVKEKNSKIKLLSGVVETMCQIFYLKWIFFFILAHGKKDLVLALLKQWQLGNCAFAVILERFLKSLRMERMDI